MRASGKRRGDICAGSIHSCDEKALRDFYRGALKKAALRKKRTLACAVRCAASEGLSGVAHAKILAQEIFRILYERETSLRTFAILADNPSYPVLKRHCLGYIDYIAHKLRPPFLTVDVIIELGKKIVVIKRTNPPFGWALPGGFVDYGESLEEAVKREAKEETGLSITCLRQLHTYSQPGRDPRFHTVGTVFIARAKGKPRAGDDAAAVRVISRAAINGLDFAFDHKKILSDYLRHIPRV